MAGQLEFARAATDSGLEPRILRAIAEIRKYSGEDVSVTHKSKSLIKFGHSPNIDNTRSKTIWQGTEISDEEPLFGDPTLGNVLDTIVSSSLADTEFVVVEGHTKSGDDLTFVVQTATLNGQTEVPLATPLHACTRIYNADATELAGAVYVFDNTDGSGSGVPTDPTDIGGYIKAGDQQTNAAYTAISATDYWILTGLAFSGNRSTGSAIYDIEIDARSTTGVWRPTGARFTVGAAGSHSLFLDPTPALIVPNNSYIRAQGISSSNSDAEVSVTFAGYLATIL